MEPASDALVYLVDDDVGVRQALAWLLRTRHLLSEAHGSAEAFLKHLPPDFVPGLPCCLLLDVRMPGISGLALFEQLLQRGLIHLMPVIFLTGHADVATAVDAVKRGAFDFCLKPFSDNALVDRVELALKQSARALAEHHASVLLRSRITELTDREREVMQRVVEGLPNKLIADELDISVRTVEVHRARVFEKMEVKSAVELVNMLRNM